MYTLREQFNYQLEVAKITAKFKGIDLDIVMVTHPKYETRISIIGDAINPAACEVWKKQGQNVKKLLTVGVDGQIVL